MSVSKSDGPKPSLKDSLAERLELLRLLEEDDLVAFEATFDGAGETADASTDDDDLYTSSRSQ